MKEKSVRGRIPIYDMGIELVVTDDMIKSQNKVGRFRRLGSQKAIPASGLAIWRGPHYCIMFDKSCLNHNLIAHECFHITHHVADYCGLRFRESKHEDFAYLNGYLNGFVYSQLKRWGIRVK